MFVSLFALLLTRTLTTCPSDIFRLFRHEVSDTVDSSDVSSEIAPLPAPAPLARGELSLPYEHLEIALETVVQLCTDPNFLVDMYINFDCDLNSNNLFSRLADFLYKTSFPHNGQLLSLNLLALDGLLAILYSVENRFRLTSATPTTASGSSAAELKTRKDEKNKLFAAAEHFNRKPKDGVKFILESGLLPTPADPTRFAAFFRSNKWISKTKLGEFLGEADEFNIDCLKAFIALNNYSGRKFVDAVRDFLQSFRIPGEAQKIERIMDLFSKDYFERGAGPCANIDASYLLCFSIVMLNTELYNPNVPPHRRMTMEGYLKNLKGTNGGKDFPPELLSDNYASVRDNEIKIPEEQMSEHQISNSTWRYLLSSVDSSESVSVASVASGVYDKFLFSLTWRQIHSAIRSIFAASTDAEVNEQMLQALSLSADICAHFSLNQAFGSILAVLGELSTLIVAASGSPYAEKLRYVQFSRNKRAQLATLALFDVARAHAALLQDGWSTVLNLLFNVSSLFKVPLIEREDIFKLPKSVLLDEPIKEKQEAAASPILGLMTSFWPFGGSSPSSQPSDESISDSDEEIDNVEKETPRERLRRLIVHDCRLGDLLRGTASVDEQSLMHLARQLCAAVLPSSGVKLTPRELSVSTFALDVLVDVILCNAHRIGQVWAPVSELFTAAFSSFTSPNALVSKAVLSVLYLAARVLPILSSSEEADAVLTSVRLLQKMSEENVVFYSERIGMAIGKLIKRCCDAVRSESVWQQLFQLAHWTLQFPKFSKEAFEGVVFVVSPFRYQQKAATLQGQLAAEPVAPYSKLLSYVTPCNFTSALATVVAFGRLPSCPVEVALESLELLQCLISSLPALAGVPFSVGSVSRERLALDSFVEQKVLDQFVTPLLTALADRTRDSRVIVRHHAMSHLQKALLAPEMSICSSQSWIQIFDKIIFPLLVELLQPSSQDTPRDVVEETRLRASSLLCKTFLHYMARIEIAGFHALWLKVISFVEMYMKADNSELLSEAVTESLKNILLVMFASGLLVKPASTVDGAPDPSGSSLWDLSWKTIDSFSPNLRKEFMLKVYPAPSPSAPESTVVPALPDADQL